MPYPPGIHFANDASNFEMPEVVHFRKGYRFNGPTIPLSSAFSASFVPPARRCGVQVDRTRSEPPPHRGQVPAREPEALEQPDRHRDRLGFRSAGERVLLAVDSVCALEDGPGGRVAHIALRNFGAERLRARARLLPVSRVKPRTCQPSSSKWRATAPP